MSAQDRPDDQGGHGRILRSPAAALRLPAPGGVRALANGDRNHGRAHTLDQVSETHRRAVRRRDGGLIDPARWRLANTMGAAVKPANNANAAPPGDQRAAEVFHGSGFDHEDPRKDGSSRLSPARPSPS
jgi:hypothetical protein